MAIPPEIINNIKQYFSKGYSYKLIHYLLWKNHGYQLNFQYLQRKIIPSLGLARRGKLTENDTNEIREIINKEIKNGCTGYENVRRTLRIKYKKNVKRQLVRDLVKDLDFDGVERRKRRRLRRRKYISKGPNYVWHIDGYDKIAQYGIYIHGCIDGYSRYIIWCKAAISKRSEVVASYFVNAIEKIKGIPVKIRADPGTENVLTATLQTSLRNEPNSFNYGPSTSNQRIERWWGYLRQSLSDFWIHQFKTMESEGHIDRKCKLHILCIQFVFLPIIQKSLHDLIVLWNSHTIRNQNIGDVISGIPEVLFKNPELEGTEDFKIPVSEDNLRRLHILNQNFTELDQDFVQIAHDVLNYYDLPESVSNFEDAKHLYTVLKESITSLLLQ